MASEHLSPSQILGKVNINDVVMHFGKEFYTMLSCDPERLHCFYGESSSMLHSYQDDSDATIAVGLAEIKSRIAQMSYKGVRVVVNNIDCQTSVGSSIIIFTMGTLAWPEGRMFNFVQTFLLAEQPNGFFILNDILRISPMNMSVLKPVESPIKCVTSELEMPEKKSVDMVSVSSDIQQSIDYLAQNKGSTWATMAAADENVWQSGVVAESKIGAVSLPVSPKTAKPVRNKGKFIDFSKSICVRKIPVDVCFSEMKSVIEKFGTIKSSEFHENKSLAFFEFEASEAFSLCMSSLPITLSNHKLDISQRRRPRPFAN